MYLLYASLCAVSSFRRLSAQPCAAHILEAVAHDLDNAAPADAERVARQYVQRVVLAPLHSEEWRQLQQMAHELGLPEQRALARSSSPRLSVLPQERLEAMTPHLVALRQILEDLSPPPHRPSWRNLWQTAPRRRTISAPEAKARLNQILHALYAHQDALRRDNAVLEHTAAALAQQQTQTQHLVQVARQIDAALSAGMATLTSHDPLKAQLVQDDILYALRGRITDLLTQLTVAQQAELAIGLIRRNNGTLLSNIERAATTTVSALQVTLLLAQSLQAQSKVMQEVRALEDAAQPHADGTTLAGLLENLAAINRAHTEAQASAEAAAQQLQKLQQKG